MKTFKTLAAALVIATAAFGSVSAEAGMRTNGIMLNGLSLNGITFNGITFNGTDATGLKPGAIVAVTLPEGAAAR